MTNPITILIVDDSELIRTGIHSFLDTQQDFKVIGEAAAGSEAIEIVARLIPDVVLLDMSMPDMDGIETTARIKRLSPHTQVVILTSLTGDQYSFPALKVGAVAYLLKNMRMCDLAEALRYAARGEATLHPQVATRILQHFRGEQAEDGPFLASLSDREMDVLGLIARGLTNSEIAQRLTISEYTVKGHVGNIRAKLQIANRVHLAVFAWRNGISSPSRNVV